MTDSTHAESEKVPNPGPDLMEQARMPGWLEALNAFLDRTYLQADRETGC